MLLRNLLGRIKKFYATQPLFNKLVPGITWFFILLLLLCLPGSSLPDTDSWLQKIYIDKWLHAGLFGLLSFLFLVPVLAANLPAWQKRFYVGLVVLFTSLWGLATEYIQHYYVTGRSFDSFDWMADTIGALIALAPAYYLFNKRFSNPAR